MRRFERRWDTADGMDKEKEEEGDDWFLGEAKGMHDLEVWGGKKESNSQAHKPNSLGVGVFNISFRKVRRGRYVLRPMALAVGECETGRPKEKKKGRLKHYSTKVSGRKFRHEVVSRPIHRYPFESPLVRLAFDRVLISARSLSHEKLKPETLLHSLLRSNFLKLCRTLLLAQPRPSVLLCIPFWSELISPHPFTLILLYLFLTGVSSGF